MAANHMKRIVILGSTGSIGTSTLRIVESLPGAFEVAGIAANRNVTLALGQARQFGVRRVAFSDPAAAAEARRLAPAGMEILAGADGVCELAGGGAADIVVCAIVGLAALRPVLAAIRAGRDVAFATKEVLVAAGSLVCRECERSRVALLPVDSEHSAIFQSLQDRNRLPWCVRRGDESAPRSEDAVARLVLTASGGPFGLRPEADLSAVTPALALKHPNWKMGPKVTIDSATMMNKGLEILEARWLFNIPVDRIGVVLHPESVVHSLVEFRDGAQVAQLGVPDMRIPIQYALTWPEHAANESLPRLDLATCGALHFAPPDEARFPCLRLAREAARAGGAATAVLNGANEVAVAEFLAGRLSFTGIPRLIETVLGRADRPDACSTLEDIEAADAWARAAALQCQK